MYIGLCIQPPTVILSTLICKNNWNKKKEKKTKEWLHEDVSVLISMYLKKKEIQVNTKGFKS